MSKPQIKTPKRTVKGVKPLPKAESSESATNPKTVDPLVSQDAYSIEELVCILGQKESFWKDLIKSGRIIAQLGKDGVPKVSKKTLGEILATYAGDPVKSREQSGTKQAPARGSIPRKSAPGDQRVLAGRRPFLGFDVERAAYARLKPRLLEEYEGKYVVFVGEEMLGPFNDTQDTMRAAYRQFGLGPIYIKQVLRVDPVTEIAALIESTPCQYSR